MEVIKPLSSDCSLLGIDDSRSCLQTITSCGVSDDVFSVSLGALFSAGLSRDNVDAILPPNQTSTVNSDAIKSCPHHNPVHGADHSVLERPCASILGKHHADAPNNDPSNQRQGPDPRLQPSHLAMFCGSLRAGRDPHLNQSSQSVAGSYSGSCQPDSLFTPAPQHGLFGWQSGPPDPYALLSGAGRQPGASRKHRASKGAVEDSPEGDGRRGQGNWNAEENCAFFDALRRCGKNFEQLHEALKGRKSKEQVSARVG